MIRTIFGAAVATSVLWAPAIAQASHSRATLVAPPGSSSDAFSLSAASGAGGAAVVGWTRTRSGSEVVEVARRARGASRFTRVRALGTGRMGRVAVSADGRSAAAMWVDGRRVAVARGVGARWRRDAPPALPTDTAPVVRALAVTPRGATAVVDQRVGGGWRLFVLRRGLGAWTVAAALTTREGGGSAAIAPDGTVVAAWVAAESGGSSLRVAEMAASSARWSASTELSRANTPDAFGEPTVNLGAGGTAVVLDERIDAQDPATRAYTRVGGGTWHADEIAGQAGSIVSGDGRVWVGWHAGRAVYASTVDADGRVGGPQDVAAATTSIIGGPGLQPAWGSLAAWWVEEGGPAAADRWLVAVRTGNSWEPPVQIARTDGVVAITGTTTGLFAAYVDTTARGRVMAVDIARGRG